VTLFSAIRLANFNVDDEQSSGFKGLPTPAAAIFVVSLPLVLLSDQWGIRSYLTNRYVLFGLVIVISYLLTSKQAMFSLKFKHFSWQGNEVRYLFVAFIPLSLIAGAYFSTVYIAIPFIVIVYILSSLFFNLINYEV
jgi:CDP-diacylglycerol--serine O-phosphatidyltransferase